MPKLTPLMEDVADFHRACSQPVFIIPAVPSSARVALRRSLINEEVNEELLPALDQGNLPKIADALADSIYVIVGTALEYGIPLDLIWEAVQNSNMAKVDPVTGKVLRRADGKILKPEGWKEPDFASILEFVSESIANAATRRLT